MTFFAFLIGGAIGFMLGWYVRANPGAVRDAAAAFAAWLKSEPWKKKGP